MSKKNIFRRILDHSREHREAALLCSTFSLCLICALADRFLLRRSDEFLASLIFEIIIFLIPLFVYFSLSGRNLSTKAIAREMNISKISHRLIFLPIFSAMLLITGTLILDMLFFGIYDITGGFTLYGHLTANSDGSLVSNILMIITFAVLPAIFEEVIFRKLMTRTYAKKGLFSAMLISGIFFSLTPFSLRLIPSFFFAGMIYCLIFIVTGSLLTSIIAHFLFNMYGLFLRTNIANYFVASADVYVLVISAIVLFLISALLFAGILSKLFVAYAKAGKTPPHLPDTKKGFAASAKSAFAVFKIPANLACVIIYTAFVVVFAFFG